MSEVEFFRHPAKQRTADSVKTLEQQTSAEVVVALRRRSGDYQATAYHFGAAAAGLVVLFLLVVPREFTLGAIALDALAAFALAALLGGQINPLARLLIGQRRLRASADAAARGAFYDLGISRTRGRNGILVFVSTFERSCVVLPDIGIDIARLQPGWAKAGDAMNAAVKSGKLSTFLDALESLGPLLAETLPRTEDDENELPDEVQS
jgi:putative membrane protein